MQFFLFVVEKLTYIGFHFAEKVVYLQLYCGLTEGQGNDARNIGEIESIYFSLP